MTELKTLKDLNCKNYSDMIISMNKENLVCKGELRTEAIKRVKSCGCYGKAAKNYRCIACKRDIWFNNITEGDLE